MSRYLLLLPLLAACASAQTPAPLDNDQVHVIVAADEKPHVKSAMHEHKLNRVMIYMQAGKQEIISKDGKKTVLDFKPGDVKWSPANGLHTSEIVSDKPVTLIELEVKKPGTPGAKAPDTPLDPLKVDPKHYKLLFENDQVRVMHVRFGIHEGAPLHEHVLNRVVVYLTEQSTRLTTPDGKVDVTNHHAGEFSWGGATKHKEDNIFNGTFEAIVVEFKS